MICKLSATCEKLLLATSKIRITANTIFNCLLDFAPKLENCKLISNQRKEITAKNIPTTRRMGFTKVKSSLTLYRIESKLQPNETRLKKKIRKLFFL